MIGTSAEISHVGKLLKIPSCVVNEDDFDAVPLFAKLAYPWASHILAPTPCKVGKWEKNRIKYESYHELAYLHPKNFLPSQEKVKSLILKGDFFLLRFASLKAHHDSGIAGITKGICADIIDILSPHGQIFISSERELEPEFEKYRININPNDMHHALKYARMYIGDSQTMTAEAAVLGTPAIRFNDFVGRLGYLDELEFQYELTYGIQTKEPKKLMEKIIQLLERPNLTTEWKKRQEKMLSEKIDLAAFMSWMFSTYPHSVHALKKNPDYQYTFQ